MPNDLNGTPVQVGDKVTISGTVTEVRDDPNYLNCTVQLDEPLPPTGAMDSRLFNTKQILNATPPAPPPGPEQPEQQQG